MSVISSKDRTNDVVIRFEQVSKSYRLYKSNKQRILRMFNKRIPYKRVLATDNVSFTIHRGETVAILGRNGAGKSTILKMITQVCYPTSGNIFINGRVSALLELTAGFDAEFTGRENLYLRGHLMGMNDQEIAQYEDAILSFADIGDYIDQPVRTYSSGMRARLGFAINANIEPEILIIDESLSVGDYSFQNKCKAKINEIIERDNTTVLLVTHSTSAAQQFCKRGIIMEKGRLVYDGDVASAIAKYNGMYK